MDIDSVQISFDSNSQWILRCILGFIIFGVALDMTKDDFRKVLTQPAPVLIGLLFQFLCFPALSFLLIYIFHQFVPQYYYPSVALGMILVAACPGGNMSNFFTHLANGNTALSVSMSAISTLAAILMTPLNFSLWGSMTPESHELMQSVNININDMLVSIAMLIGIPLSLGMSIRHYNKEFAISIHKPMKYFSIFFFILLILFAFYLNIDLFLSYIHIFSLVVLIQNGLALALGYWGARLANQNHTNAKTISIEVGIQNSGLGLILFFEFFSHLGGMGLIIAWWGIWHMISGLGLSYYWSKK